LYVGSRRGGAIKIPFRSTYSGLPLPHLEITRHALPHAWRRGSTMGYDKWSEGQGRVSRERSRGRRLPRGFRKQRLQHRPSWSAGCQENGLRRFVGGLSVPAIGLPRSVFLLSPVSRLIIYVSLLPPASDGAAPCGGETAVKASDRPRSSDTERSRIGVGACNPYRSVSRPPCP
jgi:hypothetical protein